MAGRLEGKVAVITGGTSGMGQRTVERFVEEGARVVIAGRTESAGEAIVARLGANTRYIRTDVMLEEDIKRMIDHAVDEFGRLDCLFNNAGGAGPMGSIMDLPADGFDTAIALLFRSVALGIKHAAPIMVKQGSGSIINNASVSGVRATMSGHTYSAAKAAVIHLTTTVARELGESNVRVNVISPGAIATPIFGRTEGVSGADDSRSVEAIRALLAKTQPIPRPGESDDIANAAVYLASDESSFVNGHNLVVDGGLLTGMSWSDMKAWRAELAAALEDSN